ncbi:hypothetical protein NDI45_08125 [Leptolyngbya sp. GB1-A1]|uniref:hypothetical protein n=1 Tax=Leptolyngbya sp. GB1-A1 TaxID=2933908 RepID=UPI003297C9EF
MIRSKVAVLKDGYSMLNIHPRLSVCYRALKKPGKGGRKDKIQCAYFGFESEELAKRWVERVRYRYGIHVRAIIREGDRLTDCAYEVKVWEFDELVSLVLGCAYQLQKQEETNAAAA